MRRLAYVAVAYAFTVSLVGSQLPTPLYRVFRAEFGFSALTLTLIFAVYALAVIAGLLLLGPLSDSVGRRIPLMVTPVLAAAASLLFALAEGTGALFLARLLQGLAVGIVSGTATAALVELEPRGDPGRAALAATLATAGGVALGPLLAGALVEYAGGRALPFLVYLALLAPAFAVPALLRRPDITAGGSWRPTRPSAPPALRPFVAATLAATVGWAVAGLFLAVIPSYAATLLATDNLALLGGLAFLMLGTSCAAQVMGRKVDPRQAQLAGLLGLVGGLAGVVLASPTESLAVLLVSAALAGLGHGLTWIGATRIVNRVAPEERRAAVTSTYFAAIYLGVALSAIGVGALAVALSLEAAVYVFAAAVAAAALAIAPLTARTPFPAAEG